MKKRSKIAALMVTASLSILGVSQGFAGTQTGTLAVSASVAASCVASSLSSSAMAFGSYTGTALNGTGGVTMNCTNGTPYTIYLDGGAYVSAGQRRLQHTTSPTTYINYNLYENAGNTTAWPIGTVGTPSTGLAVTGTGSSQTTTVYGQIPAAQNALVGNYADTVNITVTY